MISTNTQNSASTRLASHVAIPESRKITLRPGTKSDASPCGHICWQAFTTISRRHNFPPDFPSPEVATELIAGLLARADIYSVVVEVDGKVAGSNFLWESDEIAGLGPITVDPEVQNDGLGRRLMVDVLRRAEQKNFVGVRLVQAGFHSRSLSLYTKLGFDVR